MKRYFAGICLIVSLMFAGCSNKDADPADVPAPVEVNTLTVEGLSEDAWTYISFENGKVVGSSELGNEEEDAAWAARKDWDIALCGKLLKTNSGTSGEGQGGILPVSDKSFNAIDTAPAEGYLVDTDDVVIKD